MFLTQFCHSVPVGALVGGILAGLAVIAIIAFALRYFCRKRRVLVHAEIDPGSANTDWRSSYAPEPVMVDAPHSLGAMSPLYPNRSTSIASAQRNVGTRIASPSSVDSFILPMPPTSVAGSTDPQSSIPSTRKGFNDGMASAQSHPSPQGSSASNQLTDEQADLVTSLYNHNIPAPAIARIVQRLMAGQEVGELVEAPTMDSNHDVSHGAPAAVAPPSYTES